MGSDLNSDTQDAAYQAARHSDFLDWYYDGGLTKAAATFGDMMDREPFGQQFFKSDLECAFNRGVSIGRQIERLEVERLRGELVKMSARNRTLARANRRLNGKT